jgi:excisionase family DNA binding protein
MRVRDAARRLEVSPSTIYGMLMAGKLRGTRHGLKRGTWRISEEQLREYLRQAEVVPTGSEEASMRL